MVLLEPLTQKRVSIGTYPYTYARVSAMKGNLLKPMDYDRLLKMGLGEITKFLEESQYKLEIDELGVQYSGADLLERALNLHLQKAIQKLRRISPPQLNILLTAYLLRKDFWNIKTILRGVYVGESPETIKRLMIPIGTLSKEMLDLLAEKETMEKVIKELNIHVLTDAFAEFQKTGNLFALENRLDREYYQKVLVFAKKLPRAGDLFSSFLQNEIDNLNLTTILRLKREGLEAEKIKTFLIYPGAKLSKDLLESLVYNPHEEIIEKVNKILKIRELGATDKIDKINDLENLLTRRLLLQSLLMLHQNPLSVHVILGYLFAKEVEIRNLKLIVKGKQLGVEEEFLRSVLVVAG